MRENGPCLALHDVFTKHGFSELASEWWHFGDDETMELMQQTIAWFCSLPASAMTKQLIQSSLMWGNIISLIIGLLTAKRIKIQQ